METNDGLAKWVVYCGVLLSAFHPVRSEQMWFVSLMARVSSNCASTSMNENACARILAPNVFTVEDIVEYNRMLPIPVTDEELIGAYFETDVDSPHLDYE